ncbi:uncharacterized protein LOC109817807 [Cajanus cajan]|uniref:uncharacterized protein LOC109817807 n=1 Tax=Cajanus cajan TaxID=3821 RepID=UPI0010FB594C|nr:uncharacterized protein LOC109817807 [Cajanus cajan]
MEMEQLKQQILTVPPIPLTSALPLSHSLFSFSFSMFTHFSHQIKLFLFLSVRLFNRRSSNTVLLTSLTFSSTNLGMALLTRLPLRPWNPTMTPSFSIPSKLRFRCLFSATKRTKSLLIPRSSFLDRWRRKCIAS